MQNNIKLGVDIMKGKTEKQVVGEILSKLESVGFEVNRDIVGDTYRLGMFRKNSRQWSRIYRRDRANGFYLVVFGDEKEAATKKGFSKYKTPPTQQGE